MAQSDILEVNRQTAEVKKNRRFDDRDWKWLADWAAQELDRRERARTDREKHWKEIDRQVAMEPYIEYKLLPSGQVDVQKAWMAETELPLQAQALEVLTADARRMMVDGVGKWFTAHTQVTDEYLRKVEGEGGVRVLGDENYIASKVNQDNADKLVRGFLLYHFGQYDHDSRLDIINAESFKYGMGVARGRLERKNIWISQARGVTSKKKQIPTIVPCSIKNVYLEETRPSIHSSTVLGPATFLVDQIKYENLAIAANKGSTDPDDDDGGWMPKQLAKVVPEKNGYVKVVEIEGDIVVPRKTTKSVTIPGAILTIALGGKENTAMQSTRAVIRFRFRKYPFSSYMLFPYMAESADEVYCTSPLMKGRTVQQTATDAVNKFLDAATLRNTPPVGWDKNDPSLAQTGGPNIFPSAMWPTNDPAAIRVFTEIGGDPSALGQSALQFINLYAELTGVLPARIGAQTRSHTTATAKQAELQRGSMRTVDYVNSAGHGPLTQWLYMAYAMGRDALSGSEKISFFIKDYGGWVEIDKSMLPESDFEWLGSGGAQEEQQKAQQRLATLKGAFELDQLRIQAGLPPRLDWDAAMDEWLRQGGFDDISNIVNAGGTPGRTAAPPGIPGSAESNPGATVAALQNLGSAGG